MLNSNKFCAVLTVSTAGSSLLRFLRGTSEEESWEEEGVDTGTTTVGFFTTGGGFSALGVEALLSVSLPVVSDLRRGVLGVFLLGFLKS